MKCISNETGEIKRVPDERANMMVNSNTGWSFCSKMLWKKVVRGSTVGVLTKGRGILVTELSGSSMISKEMTEAEVRERLDKAFKTNTKVKKSGKNKGETK